MRRQAPRKLRFRNLFQSRQVEKSKYSLPSGPTIAIRAATRSERPVPLDRNAACRSLLVSIVLGEMRYFVQRVRDTVIDARTEQESKWPVCEPGVYGLVKGPKMISKHSRTRRATRWYCHGQNLNN